MLTTKKVYVDLRCGSPRVWEGPGNDREPMLAVIEDGKVVAIMPERLARAIARTVEYMGPDEAKSFSEEMFTAKRDLSESEYDPEFMPSHVYHEIVAMTPVAVAYELLQEPAHV